VCVRVRVCARVSACNEPASQLPLAMVQAVQVSELCCCCLQPRALHSPMRSGASVTSACATKLLVGHRQVYATTPGATTSSLCNTWHPTGRGLVLCGPQQRLGRRHGEWRAGVVCPAQSAL